VPFVLEWAKQNGFYVTSVQLAKSASNVKIVGERE